MARALRALTVAALVTLLAPHAAESSGGLGLGISTLAAGGGVAANGGFTLAGTIGQPAAGTAASKGAFEVVDGFWPPVEHAPVAPTPTPTGPAGATPTATGSTAATATTTAMGGGATPTGTVGATPTATPTATGGATPTASPTATVHGPTPTAAPTPVVTEATLHKCQAAIAKSATAFAASKLAALETCEGKRLAGKLAGTCPDGDPKTADKIAAGLQKVHDAIAKACGGKNKTCSATDVGADADIPLAAIGFSAACPSFESTCAGAIGDCNDIASCLGCVAGKAAEQAAHLYYPGAPADPKLAKALNVCQRAVGASAVKLFTATAKLLETCWSDVSRGTIAAPCPDAAKAVPAIAKARSHFEAAIAKACCGKNKTCDAADAGVNADVDPVTDLGAPTSCTSVTVPGAHACAGAITDMGSFTACLECVTDFKAACVAAAQLDNDVAPYPAECE